MHLKLSSAKLSAILSWGRWVKHICMRKVKHLFILLKVNTTPDETFTYRKRINRFGRSHDIVGCEIAVKLFHTSVYNIGSRVAHMYIVYTWWTPFIVVMWQQLTITPQPILNVASYDVTIDMRVVTRQNRSICFCCMSIYNGFDTA